MKWLWLVLLAGSAFASDPPERLSETGFSTATKKYYEPQYPLWSDGAKKKRWLLLPKNTRINTENLDYWTFPVGTKIWKEFRFPDAKKKRWRKVETRYLEKSEDGTWKMASYLWNADETEAVRANINGIQDYYDIGNGVKVNIPSVAQCRFCHERGGDFVLSIDAVQLSHDRPRGFNLRDLVRANRLSKVPRQWHRTPPQIPARSETERAALGYLHGNCGHCHNATGRANLSGLYLRHSAYAKTAEEEPTIVTGVNQLTQKFKIPNALETYRFHAKNPAQSAALYRMESLAKPSMPPIGRKVLDENAIRLIRKWIDELGD